MSNQITKHFTRDEIECRCGCGGMPSIAFMDKVETLRVMCGFPFRVGSCARCATHNSNIGGAKQSDHIVRAMRKDTDERGAIDIKVDEFSYERRYALVQHGISLGFDVIEICDAHVHLGIRGVEKGILFTGKSR
jgi:hypothetical protein